MHFEDFTELVEFPKPLQGIVYVLLWRAPNGATKPFYVGQTGRFLWSRMVEYLSADFQAATDFKIGEAIRYMADVKGLEVLIGQQPSDDPLRDELKVKRELLSKEYKLLNDRLGYDYRSADPSQERARIHAFCEELLNAH